MAYRSRQASPASASIARSNSRNKKGSRTSLTSGSAGRKRLTRDATIDDDVPAASAEVPGATTPMSGKHKGGKGVKSSKKDRATSAGVSAGGTEPTKTDGGLAIARAVQRSMRHGTRSEDGNDTDDEQLGFEDQACYRDPAPLKWKIFEAAAEANGQRYVHLHSDSGNYTASCRVFVLCIHLFS